MLKNGRTTKSYIFDKVKEEQFLNDVKSNLIDESIKWLSDENIVIESDNEIRFADNIDIDIPKRCKIFTIYGRNYLLITPIGCEWWDRNINIELLRYICNEVQGGIRLTQENESKALEILKLSCRSLMYALIPDQMIVRHRKNKSELTDDIDKCDQDHFMESLYDNLLVDFHDANMSRYYYYTRNISTMYYKVELIVYDIDDNEKIKGHWSNVRLIGKWGDGLKDGKEQLVCVKSHPEFIEKKRALKANRS